MITEGGQQQKHAQVGSQAKHQYRAAAHQRVARQTSGPGSRLGSISAGAGPPGGPPDGNGFEVEVPIEPSAEATAGPDLGGSPPGQQQQQQPGVLKHKLRNIVIGLLAKKKGKPSRREAPRLPSDRVFRHKRRLINDTFGGSWWVWALVLA
jgi:hypothetical protein